MEIDNFTQRDYVSPVAVSHAENNTSDFLVHDSSVVKYDFTHAESVKHEWTGGSYLLNDFENVNIKGFDQDMDASSCQYQCTSDSDLNPDTVLKDLDIYLDDLNDSLTVSRMVSDSVIKGMVNAVIEETNEKVTLKDMQILRLNEKLHQYALVDSPSQIRLSLGEMEPETVSQQTSSCLPDSCIEQTDIECLHGLQVATVEQLQALKQAIDQLVHSSIMELNSYFASGGVPLSSASYENLASFNIKKSDRTDTLQTFMEAVSEKVNRIFCLFEDTISEHRWTYNFQREFMSVIVEDSIMRIQDDFERKLYNERRHLSNNFSTMLEEVRHFLHRELELLSKSLFSSEVGHLISYGSLELLEERKVGKIKDNPFLLSSQNSKVGSEETDSSALLHMTKEELIHYYKTEMTKMKRHHESALQEKTEELFAVKREFLREKGPLPSKKDRDYEVLRKSVTETINKLDDILVASRAEDDYDKSPSNGCAYSLIWGSQCLAESMLHKNETVGCTPENGANSISCPSQEVGFMQKSDKLGWEVEDVKIEAELQVDVHRVFLGCWINETKNQLESMDIEIKTMHEIYSSMLTGSVEESKFIIDTMEVKHNAIKCLLESSLCQKEKIWHSEVETIMNLTQERHLLSELIKEKDDHIGKVEHTLVQQKEQLEQVFLDLSVLREQNIKLEQQLSGSRGEIDSMKSRLDQADGQIQWYEGKITRLEEDLHDALNELHEAKDEKLFLQNVIQRKQSKLLINTEEEKMQRVKLKSLMSSLLKMSKTFDSLEDNILEKIKISTVRLDAMKNQILQIAQKTNILQLDISCYKHKLEMKSVNLQKAEAEVDVLGDEADALLNLLTKIYIRLYDYFPILQLYPGVMEVLKLIEKEVKGVQNLCR